MAALGEGLQELHHISAIERLACEVLPNGTVIARDVKSGIGYIVQSVEEPAEELEAQAIEPLSDAPAPAAAVGLLEAIRDADSATSAASLALTLVREQVPGESGAVILADRGYMRFVSVVGPHARRLIGVRLPMGTGVAGFSMEKQRTVVLDDAQTDARHCGEVDALTGYTTEQIAVVPVQVNQRCFGVIELMNLPRGERFDRVRVEAIRGVADALAERLAEG